jgi:hypothetical protein
MADSWLAEGFCREKAPKDAKKAGGAADYREYAIGENG